MPILAEGQFTLSDLWRGTWLYGWKTLAFVSISGLLILGTATVETIRDPEGWSGQVLVFTLGLFLLGYCPLATLYRCNRNLKKSPNLQGVVRYQFDDSGYLLEALHTRMEVKWSALVKWKEGKHCFLFYGHPKNASIIPKHFFQSPADVDTVRSFLQASVPRK